MKDENRLKRKENFRLLWTFLKGSKRWFIFGVIASSLVSLADMVSPQIIRAAIDKALGGLEPDLPGWAVALADRFGGFEYLGEHLWIMAAALALIAVIRNGAQYLVGVLNNRGAETLVKTMRDSLFSHIERLPYAWHMKNHTGDLIQRCTSDVESVRRFVSMQLSNVIRIVILIVLSIWFMVRMDLRLTLVGVSMIPVILGFTVSFGRKMHAGFEHCDEVEGQVSALVQENLTGVRVVRAFARERWERDRFIEKDNYYCGLWVEMGKTMARFFSIQDILSALQVMLVIVFGCAFCVNGTMTSGDLIAFISYNSMLAWPIRRLGRMLIEMSKADVSLARIAYIMNEPEEPASEKALKPAMNGDIVFDHVSFAYEGSSETLHDISFDIEAGSTLGILGGTGSGKSTLMLLLDKMYLLPEGSGRITVGGTDIKDIDTEYLRSSISMVLQEPFLFSRTIADNIAISSRAITIDRVREASRAASLDESVREFSKGYDTFVGERGVTLSGGQKQRTAIARALVSPAPIMIFDDSLSAVDTETDAKIRGELEKRFGSSTTILISHRLTTLSKCDKIIVLDSGRVAEQGTPDELRTSGGIYQKIFEIQSGAAGPEEAAGEEA
ncbi:MAG: ABC transporter ATP-binding protein [Firmicutes bacterium]|nr:ABC transporter ATP-binding protein [Bacillota bacterium]